MVLTIAKEITFTPDAMGNKKAKDKFTVTYRIPTALDIEKLIGNKVKDSDVFAEFVIKTDGIVDEHGALVKPTDIPKMNGTYPLVTEVAAAVLRAGMLSVEEKNA